MIRASLIGGCFGGHRAGVPDNPIRPRIQIGFEIYEAVNDPETGEFLGAYACVTGEQMEASI